MSSASARVEDFESGYSWLRLVAGMVLSTIGGVGMWSVVVVLPTVQAEFHTARSGASLPYTLTMVGFAFGGILTGRMADRFGIVWPMLLGSAMLGLGYIATAFTAEMWQFAVLYGLLVGMLGSAVTFGPLMADTSYWFTRNRGLAVALCACGNYLAGAIWPGIVQHYVETVGWRNTHIGIGVFCIVAMPALTLLLRRPRPPAAMLASPGTIVAGGRGDLRLSPTALTGVLWIAGVACCVAMSMPQVHIVAYCSDMGYGVARGAEMLSLMLGFGIISRIASGFVADRMGGLATLLFGSLLQGVALVLYALFDGLWSLYVISALFGLFQGGIVPSYAIIVREYFSPSEAGARVGIVLLSTMFGMAFGGWLSGLLFDLTGSYKAAFLNGIAWNILNVSIATWLLTRAGRLRGLMRRT